MPYSISYLHRGENVATESWDRGLEEAKAVAKRAVLVGTAERSEIRDADGKLIFHFPRVMKRG